MDKGREFDDVPRRDDKLARNDPSFNRGDGSDDQPIQGNQGGNDPRADPDRGAGERRRTPHVSTHASPHASEAPPPLDGPPPPPGGGTGRGGGYRDPGDPDALTSDDRTWGMLAHLSAVIALLLSTVAILGPLIVWVVKKDESAFVDDQGKEAMNFQLLMLVIQFLLLAATLVTCGMGFVVTLPGYLVVFAVQLIFAIIGGIRANAGERYRYPFNWRVIR